MIIKRHHSFCAAHRIVGHGGKCEKLHGHNYKVTFHIEGPVHESGMVVDFAEIKYTHCRWIDKNWDHRTILWTEDPILKDLEPVIDKYTTIGSIAYVPFNPTAENMATYLLHRLEATGYPKLVRVDLQETDNCSVTVEL